MVLRAFVVSTFLCAGVAASTWVPARAAHAQPQDAHARADDLYKRGVDAFAERKLDEAYKLLSEAWSLKQSVDIAANLGMVEAKLGKLAASAEHLSAALRAYPADGSPEARQRLEQSLNEAKKVVTEVTVRANVDGAQVFVGERELGKTPLANAIFVEPGQHKVRAVAQGHQEQVTEVRAQAGGNLVVELTLKKSDASSPEKPDVPGEKPLWPTLVLAGGAAAGLGLGIGGIVISQTAKGNLEDSGCTNATCGAALQDDVDSYNLGMNLAIPGFVVGGLALAGMVTYLAIPAGDSAEPTVSFGGSIGPEGGSATWRLRF